MNTLTKVNNGATGAWLKSHAPIISIIAYAGLHTFNGLLLQFGMTLGIESMVAFPSVPVINAIIPLARGALAMASGWGLREHPTILRGFYIVAVLETIAIATTVSMVVAYNYENPKVEIKGDVRTFPKNPFGDEKP